ncbi:MAG: ribbon-helix-helix protein, CopG family [Chitinispirillales bacterium]|jgi:hypothetical protein|nr:ribbon-helix-helix protein, CopG family [Chitinispirillales bacterium]
MAVLTLKSERLQKVDEYARREGKSREEIIDEAIDKYLFEKFAAEQERASAHNRFMSFPRAKLPDGFDYKTELMEALDERFNRAN